MNQLVDRYRHWKFKNTFLLILSIVVLIYFSDSAILADIIDWISSLGLLGAFIVGIFFVSTFTVVPSSILLFHLAREIDPLGVAVFAGMGAMLGDYIIFRFLKDRVFEELRPIFVKFGGTRLSRLFATPFFAWFAPVLGAIIIISPFPDEVGVGLMGIVKLKNWQFILIAFVLNMFGILLLVTLANAL